MKVYEQGNALIDALAEQYSAEDLPGALGDVLTQMLASAIEKGASPFHLSAMLLVLSDKLPEEPDDYWSEDREAANDWRREGSGALSGAS